SLFEDIERDVANSKNKLNETIKVYIEERKQIDLIHYPRHRHHLVEEQIRLSTKTILEKAEESLIKTQAYVLKSKKVLCESFKTFSESYLQLLTIDYSALIMSFTKFYSVSTNKQMIELNGKFKGIVFQLENQKLPTKSTITDQDFGKCKKLLENFEFKFTGYNTMLKTFNLSLNVFNEDTSDEITLLNHSIQSVYNKEKSWKNYWKDSVYQVLVNRSQPALMELSEDNSMVAQGGNRRLSAIEMRKDYRLLFKRYIDEKERLDLVNGDRQKKFHLLNSLILEKNIKHSDLQQSRGANCLMNEMELISEKEFARISQVELPILDPAKYHNFTLKRLEHEFECRLKGQVELDQLEVNKLALIEKKNELEAKLEYYNEQMCTLFKTLKTEPLPKNFEKLSANLRKLYKSASTSFKGISRFVSVVASENDLACPIDDAEPFSVEVTFNHSNMAQPDISGHLSFRIFESSSQGLILIITGQRSVFYKNCFHSVTDNLTPLDIPDWYWHYFIVVGTK
ncbi:hypothetical protein ROZALSC1DRAFT_23584, partial [Rozella allomycis CSF55]